MQTRPYPSVVTALFVVALSACAVSHTGTGNSTVPDVSSRHSGAVIPEPQAPDRRIAVAEAQNAPEPEAAPDGAPTSASEDNSRDRIRFSVDASEVDEASMKLLLAHAARLKGNPRQIVTLIAHTEGFGSPSYNLALAEEEINTVTGLLRALGVPSRQIRQRRAGRGQRAAACSTSACRQRQRYVDLLYD